jgi:hypothetical protein
LVMQPFQTRSPGRGSDQARRPPLAGWSPMGSNFVTQLTNVPLIRTSGVLESWGESRFF